MVYKVKKRITVPNDRQEFFRWCLNSKNLHNRMNLYNFDP